jgi:pimeloyl-ACP methyl ester carboxylesterase
MKILGILFLFLIPWEAFSQKIGWVTTSDSIALHYTYSIIDPDTVSLIFVHGWCCNKEFWKYQATHFRDKYNTVSLDLAGYGQSGTRRNYSFETWGDDVLCVVNTINPRKYVLIGHSSGGYVVLNAATKADERLVGIIGVDSYRGDMEKTCTLAFAKEAEQNNRVDGEEFIESMRDIDSWFVPQSKSEDTEWIKTQMAGCTMETAAQGVREYYLYMNRRPDEFNKISCPIFGINKEQSKFDMKFFSSHEIVFHPFYVEDAGHFVMTAQPEKFNVVVEEIMQRVR